MELSKGMRVSVGIDDGPTYVASIGSVEGELIDLDLLDDFDAEDCESSTVTIYATAGAGLQYWRAVAALRRPGRLSVLLCGSGELPQRRRHDRYRVDIDAQVSASRLTLASPGTSAHILDLSVGGARILAPIDADTGETLHLHVELGSPLTLSARVALSYPDGDGSRVCHLTFTDLSSRAIGEIASYLATLDPAVANPLTTVGG